VHRLVQEIRHCGVLLDCLDLGGDWKVQLGQLLSDWRDRLDHLELSRGQAARTLQILEAVLDDQVDFVFGDEAQVFSAADSQDLFVFVVHLIFTQTHKRTCLSIDTFNGLTTLSNHEPDKPHRHLHINPMRSRNSTTIHFPLSLDNCIQFFSHSFYGISIAFHENVLVLLPGALVVATWTFKAPDFFAMFLMV
jgi:hypothetical protein